MTAAPARTIGRALLPPPPPLDPRSDALFLDLDGTLVAIAEHPDAIAPGQALGPLLQRARNRLGGCLVIVSGRSLADLDRHLGDDLPLAGGVHGAEMRGAARTELDPAAARALAQARRVLATEAGALLVEDKGMAIALHFRQRPDLGALAGRLAARLADASGGSLAVQPGRMVFELKPARADKGMVVRAFLAEPLFAGRRPLFVGDDLTDEAGFRAAQDAGGEGILVGDRAPTAARAALTDVAAVHGWLAALAGDAA